MRLSICAFFYCRFKGKSVSCVPLTCRCTCLSLRDSTVLISSALDAECTTCIAVDNIREGHLTEYGMLTDRISWQLLSVSKTERYYLAFE